MRVSDAFPSRWLRAADLQNREVKVTIMKVAMESMARDSSEESSSSKAKPVLYFANKNKGLVLNATNAHRIAEAYGDDMDGWKDREVLIYPDKTQFGGQLVDCIRVRVPTRIATDEEMPF